MKGRKPTLFQLALLLVISGVTNNVLANGTELKINGNIKASPCVIVDKESGTNVNLGNILAERLANPGSSGDWVSFSLKLIDCPDSTTQATVAFSGTADSSNSDFYKNTGSATHAQVELESAVGQNLGNGKSVTQMIDAITHGTTFNLRTRAYTINGNVMPGTIVGLVMATFTYQ